MMLSHFLADKSGATSIEYALIATGISIAIVVTVNAVGSGLVIVFQDVVDLL